MRSVDVVALLVCRNGEILVEKRRQDRRVDPGKVAIPGGHVEKCESLKSACRRELKEELDLECEGFKFIARLPHQTAVEDQMVHYFLCENWKGTPRSREAEKVFWIDKEGVDLLDFEIDRTVARQFFKEKTAAKKP
jgi:mutator protein MutT